MKCPCHSGKKYKNCCQPYHQGTPAPTAEALMRSRYAAYALGEADYILTTTHQKNSVQQSIASIKEFSENTSFDGLAILEHVTDGDHAIVKFHATLKQGEQDASFTETSRFERVFDLWLYLASV